MNQEPSFFPFYDRVAQICPIHFLGKLLFSAVLGGLFLGPHFLLKRMAIIEDWSWFLGVLIAGVMLLLFHATHTLHSIFPDMEIRLSEAHKGVYLKPLSRMLSDRNFILAGVFVGVLNCCFGLAFGLPYRDAMGSISISWGFFLAGFVCGMAAWGIVGASASLNAFSRKANESLDFTSPDRCAGTQFLGEACVIFGGVTLIAGVMISVYIGMTEWWWRESWWVKVLTGFWIAYPYLMSLVAFLAPVTVMHRMLRRYKTKTETEFRNRSAEIRRVLEEESLDADESRRKRDDYEYLQRLRAELHDMRTWPFSVRSSVKYGVVVVGNVIATVSTAITWLDKLKELANKGQG